MPTAAVQTVPTKSVPTRIVPAQTVPARTNPTQIAATVNYHIAIPEEQAFYIDAGGKRGEIVSPVLVPTQVTVGNARTKAEVEFANDSVAFITSPSAVQDFNTSNDWVKTYNRELDHLLTQQIGARETIVFDHTLRIDEPDAARKPARNVHSDYSPAGAHQRLRDLLGSDVAKDWEGGISASLMCGGQSMPQSTVRPSVSCDPDRSLPRTGCQSS